MKILISPSKTIKLDSEQKSKIHSVPKFINESLELASILKKYSAKDLSKLMSISDNLSEINYERYQSFDNISNENNSKQAILIFKGDVYEPIEINNYNTKDFEFMQTNLRIISGLYGILKPMDLIKPYRLEMSTKLNNNYGKNLYEFWGSKLSNYLNNDSEKDIPIINLASNEYFKAINIPKLRERVIDIEFKERKNDIYKIIGIMAKKARGEMVNYIIKNKITKYSDLKEFNVNGYKYNEKFSTDNKLSFTR